MSFKLSIKKQFIIFFLIVAVVSLILLSFILRFAIEKCFHDYVMMSQSQTHHLIIKYLENYYSKFHSWNGFDGKAIGNTAKKNKNYFTLFDDHGKMLYSTEDDIEPCCTNPEHKYWKNVYPVMYNGVMIARINIGQFTDHIYSPEDIAFRQSIVYGIVLSLIITLMIALPFSLLLSSRLSKPISRLKEAADAMSRGDLSVKLDKSSSIRELSSLTESIDQLRRSLLQQDSLRKTLTTNISHELRTPINILQNQIEAMIDGVLPVNEERLKFLHSEMERLTGLVSELEKIMEVESADFKPLKESVNLTELIKNIATGFEALFRQKDLKLTLELSDDLVIKAQKDKLSQVIINLISNAYKFTDSGSVTVRCGNGYFEIEDTGIGIAEEDFKNIFERFYRAEPSRNRELGGAGLGLAIVEKIAAAHGWKIEVTSRQGAGSIFRIKFTK